MRARQELRRGALTTSGAGLTRGGRALAWRKGSANRQCWAGSGRRRLVGAGCRLKWEERQRWDQVGNG